MKNILFITQKIDRNDDVLGVYHRWAEELGKKVDRLNIICLYKGESNLDKKIGVFSLGKEKGVSHLKYIYRFYKYIFSLRKEYDSVLVHMNPIYIVLGGIFLKLMGKKIFLWYNHPMGNFLARFAGFFSNNIFCTSIYSFFAKNKKTHIMPVGIDTDIFKPMPEIEKNNKRILFLGRISPIKKVEILIEAVKILDEKDIGFELLIVGSPVSEKDKIYYEMLKSISKNLILKNKIVFKSSVSNYKTPELYNSSIVFVNLTPTGSFDKTILEAMSCGLPVLVSNKTIEDMMPREYKDWVIFKEGDVNDLAKKISVYIVLSNKYDITSLMRKLVIERHSLLLLIDRLSNLVKI